MALSGDEEKLLQEIRERHVGEYRQSGLGQYTSSDTDDSRLTTESYRPIVEDSNGPDEQVGTTGEYIGTSGSFSGRSESEHGEDYSGQYQANTATQTSDERLNGIGGRGTGSGGPKSPIINTKPRGIIGIKSSREQEERKNIDSVTIKKVVHITPKGRVQLMLSDSKFLWLDEKDPRIAGRDLNNLEGVVISRTPPKEEHNSSPPLADLFSGRTLKETNKNSSSYKPPSAAPSSVTPPRSASSTRELLKVKRGVMSLAEATNLRDTYEDALIELFNLLDKGISGTTPGHPNVVIWSDMDDAQIGLIASSMLTLSQSREEVAVMVRQTVNIYQHGKLLTILGPRFYKMYMHYFMFGFEMPGRAFRRKVVRNRP